MTVERSAFAMQSCDYTLKSALYINPSSDFLSFHFCSYVPFAAVAAANCINIPMMRSSELMNGIPVLNEDGERVGVSKKAAESAISQVKRYRQLNLYQTHRNVGRKCGSNSW